MEERAEGLRADPNAVFDAVAARLDSLRRIPVSTYRLQINFRFGFRQAREMIPYLHDLGVSDLYVSPFFRTKKGSLHGYDILRPDELNPEAGSPEDFREYVAALKASGLGQVLDIVPNHLSIGGPENAWWMDVLENGPSSARADFFEIDWNPIDERLKNRVVLPILGDQFGRVLENQELVLVFESGGFFVRYGDLSFPLDPCSHAFVLRHGLEDLEAAMRGEPAHVKELQSILFGIDSLPPPTDRGRGAARARETEVIKERLSDLARQSPAVADFIGRNVRAFNGVQGEPRSFDLFDELLGRQVYRLCHWRVAGQEINYRRFFDINDLAAVREENPDAFREMHSLIFRMIRDDQITGLRVDHLDGLYDPEGYFRALQRECFVRLCLRGAGGETGPDFEDRVRERYDAAVSGDEPNPLRTPFYVVAEKILMRGEPLREDWPISGTTGYTFLNSANGLFIDPRGAKVFEDIYARFIKSKPDLRAVVADAKKLVMRTSMASELNTLGRALSRITQRNRHTRDFTLDELTKALVEIIAAFPVYRTYARGAGISEKDAAYVEQALAKARRTNPILSASLFDFVGDILLLRRPEGLDDELWQERVNFVMRFQQVSAPVMAKGLEDTVFYSYNRFVSLNEVGGSPERFGLSPEAFHGQNIERLKSWPDSLITTSTHDTKRSEDTRARLNVLSEIPDRWRQAVFRWSRMNRKHKTIREGQRIPDRNDEYLFYQTLAGVWPLTAEGPGGDEVFAERIRAYMIKAAREAKVHSSWTNPDPGYEDALRDFIGALLDPRRGRAFLGDFQRFEERVAFCGALNSLSQVLLKIGSPGVPDFYQGTEVWDFSLVDPDNRRPVDFGYRRKVLEELSEGIAVSLGEAGSLIRDILAHWPDGRVKLYVIFKALNHRRRNAGLFSEGAYVPLAPRGRLENHIVAFARRGPEKTALVIVPRFLATLVPQTGDWPLGTEVWHDAAVALSDEIPHSRYFNVLTGETIETVRTDSTRVLPVDLVLKTFPVALLESAEE